MESAAVYAEGSRGRSERVRECGRIRGLGGNRTSWEALSVPSTLSRMTKKRGQKFLQLLEIGHLPMQAHLPQFSFFLGELAGIQRGWGHQSLVYPVYFGWGFGCPLPPCTPPQGGADLGYKKKLAGEYDADPITGIRIIFHYLFRFL